MRCAALSRVGNERPPLSLSARIVFEQSYGGVEGDSASLAELCALLSALAYLLRAQRLEHCTARERGGFGQSLADRTQRIDVIGHVLGGSASRACRTQEQAACLYIVENAYLVANSLRRGSRFTRPAMQ